LNLQQAYAYVPVDGARRLAISSCQRTLSPHPAEAPRLKNCLQAIKNPASSAGPIRPRMRDEVARCSTAFYPVFVTNLTSRFGEKDRRSSTESSPVLPTMGKYNSFLNGVKPGFQHYLDGDCAKPKPCGKGLAARTGGVKRCGEPAAVKGRFRAAS